MAAKFKYPVYFIVRGLGGLIDLLERSPLPTPAEVPPRLWDEHDFCWTLQVYLELKHRGFDVHIRREMQPGAICVAHHDSLILKDWPARSFIVGIRPDRPAMPVAHLVIVQNRTMERGPRHFFVPLFGQPNLIPRDPKRGSRVENIVYLGRDYNLRPDLCDDAFRRCLAAMGMTLDVRNRDHFDYTDADVILAARPGTPYDIGLKPATKIYNAWRAGVPVLAGDEPAHREIRKSGLDYIEVRNAGDAVEGLRRLKEEPGLYEWMVENGRERSKEFSRDVIAQRWIDVLSGPVTLEYERWCRRGRWLPPLARDIRFAGVAAMHKAACHIHKRRI